MIFVALIVRLQLTCLLHTGLANVLDHHDALMTAL